MPVTTDITKVKNLPNIEDTPVVEVFQTTARDEDDWLAALPNDDSAPVADIDGAGLLIYFFEGNRAWFKTSVSKTPAAYLKKSLTTTDSTYFKFALLVRGTNDYPLTEKEIKTLSGMLYERLRNTSVAGFTSYTTISEEKPETQTILNNVLEDIIALIASSGFDVSREENPAPLPEEFRTGTEVISVNGLQVTVTAKLKNETSPEEGLEYLSVKVNDTTGAHLLSTSTGTI